MSDLLDQKSITPQSASLQAAVRQLQSSLQKQYRGAEWQGLAGTLQTLSKTAEHAGQKALCLQAQAIAEIIGHKGGGRELEPGLRLSQLMEQLMSQVSHWSWSLDDALSAKVARSTLTH
jgi:hypothetical protein